MLACTNNIFHGPATFHRQSQPSKFLLSKPLLFPRLPRVVNFGKLKFNSLFSVKNSFRRFDVKSSVNSSSEVL
ncbi:unnamed protein product [Lathyrus sativus]|nr:unnamed protein product [Lathyrus sativus]